MSLEGLALKVKKLLENPDTNRRRIAFHNFPIKVICGIDVFIAFEFINYKDLIVNFTIEASNARFVCDEYYIFSKNFETIKGEDIPFSSVSLEMIIGYFERVINIIPTLHLDKYDARLTDEPNIYTEELLERFKFENTELKFDICSVCNDICGTTTTECKHYLCIECCGRIAETDHDCHSDGLCDDCGFKKCPLCRTEFLTLQKA